MYAWRDEKEEIAGVLCALRKRHDDLKRRAKERERELDGMKVGVTQVDRKN